MLTATHTPYKFDAIIVLGCPAQRNGQPSTLLRARVERGVELYRKNYAPRLIFSGSAVYNQHTEAVVMANLAMEMGVPQEAIVLETKARNTGQNAFFTTKILRERLWKSAVIVTSPYHLRRAHLHFTKYNLEFVSVPSDYPQDVSLFRKIIYHLWEVWQILKINIKQLKPESSLFRTA
ncbi:MAG: YdcF family protein [Cytophagales bacterium]|nr:MAG: YdcF family protein [Cytophagales bacterium]TAF62135.1 MAG: YdcF family protein [Cytophagales bacterium]